MSILFHSTFINNKQWLRNIKKKFKGQKIYTFKDKPNYDKIDYAIVWNLPDKLFAKLKNLRAMKYIIKIQPMNLEQVEQEFIL